MAELASAAYGMSEGRLKTVGMVLLVVVVIIAVLVVGALVGGLAGRLKSYLVIAGLVLLAISLVAWVLEAQWAGQVAGVGGACLFLALIGAMVSG